MTITQQLDGLTLDYNDQTQNIRITCDGVTWESDPEHAPQLVYEGTQRPVLFSEAATITSEAFENGTGIGIRTIYSSLPLPDATPGEPASPYSFEAIYYIERATRDLYCEWIPLCEEGPAPTRVLWPAPFRFETPSAQWYTLLTQRQGLLIPNTWETALRPQVFGGQFLTAGAYMPWFAQVKDRAGYIAISLTPWDAGCHAEHPAYEPASGEGAYTSVAQYLLPSLGAMRYRRTLRYSFRSNCDYNDLCKIYRDYVREDGRLRTLTEKAVQNKTVRDLIECSWVHAGIKTMVQPDSEFYDPAAPDKNNHLTPFAQRAAEIKALHAAGAGRIYLHLDGWAEPGYDNCHPDYYPVCQEAGGEEAMRQLIESLHEDGDLFGIHDQYRDYYKAAPSYSDDYACKGVDGSIYTHRRWAGGPQAYLCASQAPFYVRRNFTRIGQDGIAPDCAYLDVFTCNDADECTNPEHTMTRRDCLAYRSACFSYLLAHGILTSSEEASDYAIPSLVFCHYAPYDFMLEAPGSAKQGIPVPLYSLVYHDCLIVPWMMERVTYPAGEGTTTEDYMLYALLAGGAPYLRRDAAYPNIDGAFGGDAVSAEEMAARCKVVSDLYRQIAERELLRHELVDGDPCRQRSYFAGGITVTVDLRTSTYEIAQAEA